MSVVTICRLHVHIEHVADISIIVLTISSVQSLKNCSVGEHLKEECHLLVHTRSTALKLFSRLTAEQVELVVLRTGIPSSPDLDICLHHEKAVLVRYPQLQRKCCNPFGKHKKPAKDSLRELSLETAKKFSKINISVIPGQKQCTSCRKEANRRLDQLKEAEHVSDEVNSQTANDSDNGSLCSEMDNEILREDLNTSLEEMDLSPVKLHAVAVHARATLCKRKFQQVQKKLKEEEEILKKQVAEVADVLPEELNPHENNEPEDIKELKKKAGDLDTLVGHMKDKIKTSNNRQKKQVLTMMPPSGSIKRAQNEFEVSEYMVREAKKLVEEKGSLELPDQKKGKGLSEDVVKAVKNFYCDDEYSRQMQGKKDCKSIGRNLHMQKRLLLCDLKELYAMFKKTYPDKKVGFSKFCSLRPKWCVLVGCSGTQSVCVCTIHQNVTLMLAAVKLEKDHREVMEMMVCSRSSKECMIHRCPNCPDTGVLEQYLNQQLKSENEEANQDSEEEEVHIQFQQWTNVDHSELVSHIRPVSEFISLLIEKLQALTTHSFIATSQAKYLKKVKEELRVDKVIVLGDFAENYKFIIQDEIQGFHWNKQSCTLHPIVTYHIKDNKLTERCLCFISDDLNHDTGFVHEVMKRSADFIKEEICPEVSKMYYFSDGCAGQYKNCKNFINLCLHEKDFSIECSWSFFATSHGKSPCDGVGGTLKCLTARASLQRPLADQILTPTAVFHYCKESVQGINVFLITTEEMEVARKQLKERFSSVTTLPGTRSFHHFVPLSESVMAAKWVSEDQVYAIEFDLIRGMKSKPGNSSADPKLSDFVVCAYDEKHWIGIVDAIDEEHDDIKVKFMHPCYPARSYNWPGRDDICFVPNVNVLCIIGAPVTVTGRQYKLNDEDIDTIEQELSK